MGYAGRVTTTVVFNPFVPSFRRNPYLQYARLREGDPVHRSGALQAWVLTRHADCLAVMRDHERFSSDSRTARGQLAEALQQQRRESPLPTADTMLGVDPPRHTQLRGLVSRGFTPRRVEELRPRIESIMRDLLDAAGSRFDLMTEIAQPLPVIVIAELLGVSPADRLRFKDWSRTLANTTNVLQTPEMIEAARVAILELIDYFTKVIDERRLDPRDDLISALVRAEEDGQRLSREDVLAFAILLLVAGNETTTNLIGNGLAALLDHPEAMEALRAEPARLGAAIEEMLRFDSPVQGVVRFATRDLEIAGQPVAAGDVVLALTGAANRDPAVFADPDRFDIARFEDGRTERHLSFGQGIHYCLGAPLARMEAGIVFSALLDRFAAIRAVEPGIERGGTLLLRGPVSFPVEVTAR